MRFTFIHAADLHIDSPLAGLRLKDDGVGRKFFEAGRRAVQALVDEAIASKAAFLIIAGDVFDGDWKDIGTGMFFVRTISALDRAGIPTFIVKGNHDAESLISRDLPYPSSVTVFPSNEAATVSIDELRISLHGRSFPSRMNNDFVASYPARREGWLNIGVLHTSLDGTRGHEGYAPCSEGDLRRFGYDYWALGHIHTAEVVSKDPWIVFPGNLQGRSIRETGPKGAMRVTVENGCIVDVEPLALDSARWAHIEMSAVGVAEDAELFALLEHEIVQLCSMSGGKPLAIRITLNGDTELHNHLVAHRERILDDLRAYAVRHGEHCWIEQLKVRTVAPPRMGVEESGTDDVDLDAILRGAAGDPEFEDAIADLVETMKAKLPRDLQDQLLQSDVIQGLSEQARAMLAGELG